MPSYQGDILAAQVLDFKFGTNDATGASATLGGTPAVSVYKSNSTTESTTGVSLTADFDGRTGCNHVRVDTSADGTFYAAGNDFEVVITTGTVGGISVVGQVVATFSIENRTQKANVIKWNSTTVATPNVAGYPLVDLAKAAGTAVTLDANNALNVSAKYLAGTALTGRDIGASVLLSPGTGTGQISLSSGNVTFSNTSIATVTTVTNQVSADVEAIAGVSADAVTFGLFVETLSAVTGKITNATFANASIPSTAFASGAITAAAIASNALTSAKVDATVFQAIAKTNKPYANIWYISPTGTDGASNGTSPTNPLLTPQYKCIGGTSPATAGDLIVLMAGTFSVSTPIDLPHGVSLCGAGIGATFINSSVTSSVGGGTIVPGNNSEIWNFSGATPSGGTGGTLIGSLDFDSSGPHQKGFTGAYAHDLHLFGNNDVVHFAQTHGNQVCELRLENFVLIGGFDCITASPTCTVRAKNGTIIANGSYGTGVTVRGIICNGGLIEVDNVRIDATGGSSVNYAIASIGGNVIAKDCQLTSSGTGAADFAPMQSAIIKQSNCNYSSVFDDGQGGSVVPIQQVGSIDATVAPFIPTASANATATAAAILLTPANKIATDSSHNVSIAGGGGGFAFTGAFARTFTVNDGSTAISAALVRVTQGSNSELRQTDGSGQCSFSLDAGSYTIAISRGGYTFTPATLVVSAAGSTTYSMTAVSIPSPPDPTQTTAYLTTYDSTGTAKVGVIINIQMISGPGNPAQSHESDAKQYTSSGASVPNVTATLLRSTVYRAWRGDGRPVEFTTTNTSTFALPETLGTDV